MKEFEAVVNVKLKDTIKDIKAQTLEQAVHNLIPVKNLKCMVGSRYSIKFEANDKKEAEHIIKTIADEILSNSVIEEYEILW